MNNEYELNRHKKSDTVKWIVAFALIAVLLVGMAASLILAVNNGKDKEDDVPVQEEIANDFTASVQDTQFVKLSMSKTATVAADNSVSKTLTATVLPATATNKTVDWTVEWGDESNTADVSQYLTVTPASNGSTTATVTCKQAFTGTIVITVTTRESGFMATCVVSFTGLPTDIVIDTSVATSDGDYKVGIGGSYEFNVSLTNPFGSVGSQFNNVTCSVTGVGSFKVGYMEHYNQSGKDNWYEETIKTVTLDSLKDSFINIGYADGKITIGTVKSIESYYKSVEKMDGGRTRAYEDKFYSFVDDCYFRVTVKESVSGLTKTFNIRFDDSLVTGVDMNNTEMEF